MICVDFSSELDSNELYFNLIIFDANRALGEPTCQRVKVNLLYFPGGNLSQTDLLIGKVWVPVMDFCACLIHCRVHWRVGRRLGSCRLISVQPLTGVNHLGILYKLCSVGIGGFVLSILTQFQSNRSQNVMVDGCRSKLVNVLSGVPQSSVLGQLLFLLYTLELFSILENKLIGCADDSTLMAVAPFPGVRVAVAESLIRDLDRVCDWCDLWGIKLNASKTRTIIVLTSRTMHPQSSPLTILGTVLKESDDLFYIGSDI